MTLDKRSFARPPNIMSRERIPDGVFSIIHYLPKLKKTEHEVIPAAANINISVQKKIVTL